MQSSLFQLSLNGDFSEEQLDAALALTSAAENDRSGIYIIQGPTGLGKTRVGIGLIQHYVEQGYSILWVAKKWTLLEQVTDELLQLFPHYRNQLRRVGGESERLRHLPTNNRGKIYLTTLQTWRTRHSRKDFPKRIRRNRKLLVVWDECHWAINAPTGREFQKFYLDGRGGQQRPVVVGLSATPKRNVCRPTELVSHISYAELVGTRLARPIVKNVQTKVSWDPIIRNHSVTAESLDVLATNRDRNEMIVHELQIGREQGKYRKSVVFACNIDHAKQLGEMLTIGGTPARVLHSGLRVRQQQEILRQFRTGTVDVLVNVQKFVEGENVPEIDSVFIARPTTSQVMLQQMIGRGSRLTAEKSEFWIIEFSDEIRNRAEEFFHASDLIDDKNATDTSWQRKPVGPRRHAEPREVHLESLTLPDVGELVFVPNQTFGVEIELTSPNGIPDWSSPEWRTGAHTLLACLRTHAHAPVATRPMGYHESCDPTRWVVEHDRSAGWEVVSPILENKAGFEELQRVCSGLDALVRTDDRFHLNYRTGLHVTLATRLDSDERLQGFVKRLQRLEPGLMTLVAPSRFCEFDGTSYHLTERNGYCRPMRETIHDIAGLRLQDFALANDRYYTVNLAHAYDDIQKLEVRIHSGTTEFRKIAAWISLWMLIFNTSRYQWSGLGVCGPVFPGGDQLLPPSDVDSEDIFALLQNERIFLGAEFAATLRKRRSELRSAWKKVLPQRVASWTAAGWYDELPAVTSGSDRVAS